MPALRLALLLCLVALASPAAAEEQSGPTGFAVFGALGGGGAAAGSRGDATRGGLFEAELGAGFELGGGLRPELALTLAIAPETHVGLRPGVRYALEGMPFFLRGALDFSAPGGSWRMRWLLAGAGAEVRVTDQLGLGAEADLGVPLASKAGFGFLLRAGVTFRF